MKTFERHTHLLFGLLAASTLACGDGPTTPPQGTIDVVIQTLGVDLDLDGYDLMIDSAQGPHLPFTGGSRELRPLPAGSHTVGLAAVAKNCAVQGTNPQTVVIIEGRSVSVTFTIVCETSGVEVVTNTTGQDLPDWFTLLLNGGQSHITLESHATYTLAVNGSYRVSPLPPGTHKLALLLDAPNCRIEGGNEITVEVSLGSLAPVQFDVICSAVRRPVKIAVALDTLVQFYRTAYVGLMNTDGSEFTLLERGDTPTWSSHGTRLLFSTVGCDWDWDLDPKNACNGGLRVRDPEGGEGYYLPNGTMGLDPSWAPSGEIAYIRCCDYRSAANPVAIISNDAALRPLAISGVQYLYAPAFSPDGQHIAFTCITAFDNLDLCVVDRDGSHLQRLTNTASPESEPAWSPDGTRIAFTVNDSIAVMAAGGGEATRLTAGREPAWSADGTKLVFVTRDGLYTIQADGAQRTLVKSGQFRAPAWRP